MDHLVVDVETAEREFERFGKAMRIERNLDILDENDRGALVQDHDRIKYSIQLGEVVVDEEGVATYTPLEGDTDPIVFYKPKGAALKAMDKAKKTSEVGKMFTSMAALTRQTAGRFAKMDVADLRVCQALWSVLAI